jgi:hypothetical protein
MLLLTTETRRAQRKLFFARSGAPLTQRDRPLIGQTGNPPEGWDSKRSAEKRSQPFGYDLVHRWLHVNGWRQAKELAPQAEARCLPAREKKHPLCTLCLCGLSSIRPPQAVIVWSKVTNRFPYPYSKRVDPRIH